MDREGDLIEPENVVNGKVLSPAEIEEAETQQRIEDLDIKIYVQHEVMKILGFLPFRFNSMASFEDSTKLTSEEAVVEANWGTDVGGVQDTSYAAIFDQEYQKFLKDKNNHLLLELKPHEAIQKLAEEIRKKKQN
jgi:hypothetical protein